MKILFIVTMGRSGTTAISQTFGIENEKDMNKIAVEKIKERLRSLGYMG